MQTAEYLIEVDTMSMALSTNRRRFMTIQHTEILMRINLRPWPKYVTCEHDVLRTLLMG